VSVMTVLQRIRSSPTMFLGCQDPAKQLRALESLLHGYRIALVEHSIVEDPPPDLLRSFGEFVESRHGWPMDAGVVSAILSGSSTHDDAWRVFWDAMDEFTSQYTRQWNGPQEP